MRYIVFIYFIFLSVSSFCQVTIKGVINDAGNNKPINNVNILIEGTKKGVTSNKDGNFILNGVKLPCVLKVSHIAFLMQELNLTRDDIKGSNTINLNIKLVEKTNTLNDIFITYKPEDVVEYSVIDYEICDSNIYVITENKNKSHFRVYNFKDNYFIKDDIIPDEYNCIQYDLSNVLSIKEKRKEEYYKVLFDDKSKIKLERQDSDLVKNRILSVLNNKNLYDNIWFSFYAKSKSINNYDVFNGYDGNIFIRLISKQGRSSNLYMIYKTLDSLRLRLIYRTYFSWGDHILDENNICNLGRDTRRKEKGYTYSWNTQLSDYAFQPGFKNNQLGEMGNPTIDPSFFIYTKKNIYIINFFLLYLYRLDTKGFLLDRQDIDNTFVINDYSHIKGAICNQEKTRCFIIYKIGSKTELKEINLSTGRYIKTISLSYLNADKIRIAGDYIYYKAKGIKREIWLYKEKID